MRKSQKIFFIVLIILLAILLSISLYLSLFFPYNQVRSWMKKEARETFGVHLELGEMHFSLLHGLSVEDISLADPPSPSPFFQIRKLTIDYDLWALFVKKIKIKQILLDSPQINLIYQEKAWNLERIADRLKKEKPLPLRPSEKIPEKTSGVSGLPLEIDLEDFLIVNPQIFINKPEEFQSTLAGINIQVKGSLGEKSSRLVIVLSSPSPKTIFGAILPDISLETHPKANLQIRVNNFQTVSVKGELELKRMQMKLDKKIPPLSIDAKINADLDLLRETGQLSLLDISVNQSLRVNLSADIKQIFTTPEISAAIKKLNIDFDPLGKIAAAYFPEMSLGGKIEMKDLSIQGNINEDKTLGSLSISNGLAQLKGIECKIPSEKFELKEFNGIVNLRDTTLNLPSIIPHTMQWDLELDCQNAAIAGFHAKRIKGLVEVKSGEKTPRKKQVLMSVSTARLIGDQGNSLRLEEIRVNGIIRDIELQKNKPAAGKLFVEGQFKSGKVSDTSLSGFKTMITGNIQHPDLTGSELNMEINLREAETGGKSPFQASGLNAHVHLNDLLLEENTLKRMSTKVTLNNRSVSLANPKIASEDIAGTLEFHASGERLEKNKLAANFNINRIKLDFAEIEPQEIGLKLSGKAKGDFRKGNMAMDSLRFEIDDFGVGTYSADITGFDKFSLSGSSVLDLKKMTKKFSRVIQDTVGKVSSSGKLIVSSKLKTIPSDSIGAQRKVGRSKPPAKTKIKSSSFMLDFESKVKFQDTDLLIQEPQATVENLHSDLDIRGQYSVPEGIKDITLAGPVGFRKGNFPKLTVLDNEIINLTIKNLQFNTKLSHQEGATKLSGRLDLGSLSPQKELEPLSLIYKMYLEPGFDRLQIERGTRLALAGEQIRLDVAGEIGGLKFFLRPDNPITLESVLKNLSVHLDTGFIGSSDKYLNLMDDFSIQGRLKNELEINLNPGRFFNLEGKLHLNNFHAKHEDTVQLEKMTLIFPYRKKFLLFKVPEKEKAAVVQSPLALQETFTSLGRFSQTRNNLRIYKLKVGKVEARNIFGDLALEDDNIGADRFGMDLFGGGVGGNFIIFSDSENHVIQFFTEFAGISFDSVMPRMYRTGNPQDVIGGNFKLVIYLRRQGVKEKIDLKRIDLHLRITHIGYASLNQLLLFLDPEESNPSILHARDTLKWATPVMVDLKIAYGNISLALELESKVLGGAQFSLPVLNRIPLDLLKNFDKIDKALNKLAPLNQVMEILSAKGVAFDEENNLKFLQ